MTRDIRSERINQWGFFLLAIIVSFIVVGLKLSFSETLGIKAPFMLFIFVPIAISYFGGWKPGAFAALLTALLTNYYFIAPTGQLAITDPTTTVRMVAYLIEVSIALWLIHSLHQKNMLLHNSKQQLEQQVIERTHKLEESSNLLKKLNDELQRSNTHLEEFAYVASHDLQEPLRKIQSFGHLLEVEYKDTLNGDGAMYLQRMLDASGRMRILINDLLMYSRVRKTDKTYAVVDLNGIFPGILSDMEVIIQELKAEIKIDTLPTVEADVIQMQQLFQNLISNSLRYSHPKRTPSIHIYSKNHTENPHYKIIVVKDNGIGFENQYRDKIFQIFERLHSHQEKKGTGIGLAISKKIVEQHQGTITAQGKPQAGARFEITLPVTQSARG